MIKWLKEGYIDAIKKVIDAHKWAWHKGWWGTFFILPYIFAESIIIWIVLNIIASLFGSSEPTMPLTIENDYQWVK